MTFIAAALALLSLASALPSPAPQKVDDPPGAAPRRVELRSDYFLPRTKRVKIRSGPYSAPNMKKVSFVTKEHGTLWNYPDTKIEKPCIECTILRQWAGLEYADGSDANIDTGLWLHHMVHFTAGPTRWDPVCYNSLSMPHGAVKMAPKTAERYFTSGNERSVFEFNRGGKDMSYGTGYHITASDNYAFLVDLMNMNMEDKIVYMTMTYDFLDGPLPPGWNTTKSVWLDAFSCGTSEVRPLKQSGSFTISSNKWTPNFAGRVIDAVGHLHDGGVATETRAGKSASLCNSTAAYAESAKYVFPGPNMAGTHVARDHISSMSKCELNVKRMTRDQSWQVIGSYNYDKHEGNREGDKQSEIMAISMVLIETPPGGAAKPK